MPAKSRKAELKPHTDMIVEMLARFKTSEEICLRLAEKGVEATNEDLAVFHAGKYPKMIEKRSKEIVATLPIMKSEYMLMLLDEIVRTSESPTEKLSALRIRTSMMKKTDTEESAEELMRGED